MDARIEILEQLVKEQEAQIEELKKEAERLDKQLREANFKAYKYENAFQTLVEEITK